MRSVGEYCVLGESLDDAAGEAFDKTAKLLGLGFPGGPAIAECASRGTPDKFVFARPMTDRPGLDFSFSGLKTQVRTTAERHDLNAQTIADIAHGFETAVVETLAIKCARALRQSGRARLVVSGGVGANARLRARLREVGAEAGAKVFYPRPELCTDNGAMIAYAGWRRLQMKSVMQRDGFDVRPRWNIDEI